MSYEPVIWEPEQIRAFNELSELHPGEALRADSMANPGHPGFILVRAGDEEYVLTEEGGLLDGRGVRIDPGVIA